jgi:uncharacterized membrane protein
MEAQQSLGHSAHRLEALSDGIYAVAMTLLVIELKVPEGRGYGDSAALAEALAERLPVFIAWVLSFFVLALFWYGHHRAFAQVRRPSGRLTALTIMQLAFVSLMPFSCGLLGAQGRLMVAQYVYSLNMSLLAISSLLIARHIHACPDPGAMSMPDGMWRGVRLRTGALVVISAIAVAISAWLPGVGTVAYMLMAVIMPWSRRVEASAARA